MSAQLERLGAAAAVDRDRDETLADVCHRYVADQPNAATGAKYRLRLQPVVERHGAIGVLELTPMLWAEIERTLVTARSKSGARQAFTHLRTALRAAGYEGIARWLVYGAASQAPLPEGALITLVEAARQHRVGFESLRALVDADRVRNRGRRRHGRGESIVFDAAELSADLARLPRCLASSCRAPGTGASGYCGEHFDQGGRERHRKHERDVLADHARDWYTAGEAACAAPASRNTIAKAILAGDLAAEKVGRHWRIPRGALHEWAKRLPENRPTGEKKPSAAQLAHRRQRVATLHATGVTPGRIAQRLHVSKHTIINDLAALGLRRHGQGRTARRLPPADRARRRARATALYQAGKSLREVAIELDSSSTQVRRDLQASGVEIRPQRRQPLYPLPVARACEYCGHLFTPPCPAADARRGWPMRFHGDACARRWRTEQRTAALAERDLLGTGVVARELGISIQRAHDLIQSGLLRSESVPYPGMLRPVHGIDPDEIKRFLREWARGGDGRRQAALDPSNAVAAAERRGTIARMIEMWNVSAEEARGVVREQAERRRHTVARHRMGRRPQGAPSAHHVRWLERFEYYRAELAREYADGGLDDEPPTRWRAIQAVAEEDWAKHPHDWPRDGYPPSPGDPDGLDPNVARRAAERVSQGIKYLQSALKRISSV